MKRAEELADLDEVVFDKEELRATVRAAVQAELEPLLRGFAEQVRATRHAGERRK